MADDDDTQHRPPEPSPEVKSLDRLVGAWEVSGDYLQGTTTFEWVAGGFFLIQRFDFERQDGQGIQGFEVIGHERRFGAEPSEEIRSRVYTNTGDTLDYVYELEGDTLMIWFGEKGSSAYYEGMFSEDGDTLTGAWRFPGGGGYEATSTRVE